MAKSTGIDAATHAGTDVPVRIANPVGDGEVTIAATAFLPTSGQPPTRFLICVPGGGFTREYWHPSNLDDSYSFALAMTGDGYGVITMDTLGTGESDRVDNGDDITLEAAGQANHRVVQELRARIANGSLVEDLAPVSNATYVGVGHSLGAQTSVAQQGQWASYDAIALLGYTNLCDPWYVPHEREAELTADERETWARETVLESAVGETWDELSSYTLMDPAPHREWMFFKDVPKSVIAAAESGTTVIPRRLLLQAILPGVCAGHAAQIACPVFLALGEIDGSPDPFVEPSTYPSATDITFLLLPGSAHCHNYSTPRTRLWQRLSSWVPAIA